MLTIIQERAEFNTELIKVGGFVRAKNADWAESKNGLVSYVDANKLKAIYLTGVNSAANYFVIKADELDKWELRYSEELTEIWSE